VSHQTTFAVGRYHRDDALRSRPPVFHGMADTSHEMLYPGVELLLQHAHTAL
jgi:hypothetical protein